VKNAVYIGLKFCAVIQTVDPEYLHESPIRVKNNKTYADNECRMLRNTFLFPYDQLIHYLHAHKNSHKRIQNTEVRIKVRYPGNKKVFRYPYSQVKENKWVKKVKSCEQLPFTELP
jgi:hypothetical protein